MIGTLRRRMSFEYDYSDDTTMTLIYETTQADDQRLRAARQFCKQDKFYGCSPFESGNDAVWSPGSYGHWSLTCNTKHRFRLHNL